MPEKDVYEKKVAAMLKAEIKRAGLTYAQLVEKLESVGIHEKEANVRNKLARGKFSAAFMIQCLEAIELKKLVIIRE